MMTKIDILISTYNRADSLKRTLLSLEKIHWPAGFLWSVIIVDNNSKDETQQIVQDLSKQLHFKLQYVFEEKPGKVLALEKALGFSKADIVVFTDDDVTFDANWLNVLVENFKDNRVSGLTGKIIPVYSFPKPVWYSDKLSMVLGAVDLMNERKDTKFATGANMAFKRTVLDTVGFMNGLQGRINEDTLLSHRITQQGFKIIYDPALIVYHHFQEEKFTRAYFQRWYWNSGRAIAQINQEADQKEGKKIFGVPLWRFRQALEHRWSEWKNRQDEKARFYHELQVRRFKGYLSQKWSVVSGQWSVIGVR